VLIVRGYRLGDGVTTSDTVRYAVEFQVVGIVGVSEGGPQSDERVRTTADVARGYFDLDMSDRSLLDSAVAVPRRP
jgi:hypothetical protein